MKRRILITVTDTRRFRQFTLGEVVKWLLVLVVLGIVVTAGGTWFYMKKLEERNEEAQLRQKVLERRIVTLQKTIDSLNRGISRRRAELERLGDRLTDLETMMGESAEGNLSTARRLANVTLSAAQIALLFELVPNGPPLPMAGITSAFGWRTHPITRRREFHAGIDLRAKGRKPVWTTADGVVEFAGYHKRSGFGNLVIIDHGFGFKTYYGHMRRVTVRKGDTLVKGDVIGISGNTGLSTAPHLHYEIRFLGRPINPYWFIRWRKARYKTIFEKVKQVPWESFTAMIGHMAAQAVPPSSPPAAR